MGKYLSNEMIKEYIYKKGLLTGEEKFIKWNFNIYFEKAKANKLPGTYIFLVIKGYHVEEVGDRGGIICRRTYYNITDLAYDVYEFLTWICAYEYAEKNKFKGYDKGELLKNYQINLMKKISEEYYNKLLKKLI